ncbi:hypothetical protein JL720_4426 [Aureococcus anophagefferens]|nr:hypothetical protein JL720_4426 [Aureococcus anophagefferens]
MGRLRVAAGLLLVVAAAAGVAPAAPGGGTLAAPQRRRLSARTSRKRQRAALGASLAAAAAAAAVAVALSSAAYFSRPLSDQRPRNVVAFFLAVLLLGADCALALPTRRELGAAAYGVLVATIALTLAVNAYVVNVVAFDDRCSALDRFQEERKTRRRAAPRGVRRAPVSCPATRSLVGNARVRTAAYLSVASLDGLVVALPWLEPEEELDGRRGASRPRDDDDDRYDDVDVDDDRSRRRRRARRSRDRRRRPGRDATAAAVLVVVVVVVVERRDRRRRRRKKRSGRSRRRRSPSSGGDRPTGGAAADDGGLELLELPGREGDRGADSV